jgi:hypothetical protein
MSLRWAYVVERWNATDVPRKDGWERNAGSGDLTGDYERVVFGGNRIFKRIAEFLLAGLLSHLTKL